MKNVVMSENLFEMVTNIKYFIDSFYVNNIKVANCGENENQKSNRIELHYKI